MARRAVFSLCIAGYVWSLLVLPFEFPRSTEYLPVWDWPSRTNPFGTVSQEVDIGRLALHILAVSTVLAVGMVVFPRRGKTTEPG